MKSRRKPVRSARQERLLPDQDFFRKIDEPLAFRRSVLEASKSSLSVLKGVYSLKELRQRKLEKLTELQKNIREIKLLIQKAEELMPKYTRQHVVKTFPVLAEPKKIAPQKKPVEKRTPEPKKEPVVIQKSMSELDRLTQNIQSMEKRINELPKGKDRPRTQNAPGKNNTPKAQGEKKPEDLGAELGRALESIHKKLKDI